MKTLNDLFTQTSGKALKKSNQNGSLHKYITTSNLFWGRFDFSEVREMYFMENELEKCTAKKGDLLVCNGGDVGRSAVWEHDYDICLQNHITRLRPKSEDVFPKFYYYAMYYIKNNELINGNGVGIASLSAKELMSIKVPHPSLPEQQKIAAHLDSIQSAIDNKKQQLSELDELVKSKFVEMFGDISTNSKNFELLEFNEICTSLKSGLSRKLSDEDIGLPVIRSINIKNGEFVKAPIKYWYRNDPQKANTEDYFLRTNDILVNFINSTSQIGKCCIYQDIGRDCIYTTNIFSMRLDKKCEPIYFNSYAQTDYYFKQIETITQGAVNQASFTTKNFLKLKMPVPPIELQNDFATFVQKIDTAKSIIKTQLADLQELLDSKMDEYFGE